MTRPGIVLNGLALLASAAMLSCSASAAWPDKPIHVVLPYAAGGSGDVVLRSVQGGLEKRLGQSLVVDYRTGGNGLIGVREVVKAPPDGYTLLLGPTNNFVIDQFIHKEVGFDPLEALDPVTLLADTPYMVVINAATGTRTYAEFAAYARANKGKLNYGSPGAGTIPHLSGYLLSEAMGADMTHIAFRGNAPAIVALLAGQVDMVLNTYGASASMLSAGKLLALAVGSSERLKSMPAVPTAAEAGIPAGIPLTNWWCIAAPRGVDRAVMDRLLQATRGALSDPELRERYAEQGWIVGGEPTPEVVLRLKREAAAWKTLIERTGIKSD